MAKYRPIKGQKFDHEWTGPLCLFNGDSVYKEYTDPYGNWRGLIVDSEGQKFYGYWDKKGISLAYRTNGVNVFPAEEIEEEE